MIARNAPPRKMSEKKLKQLGGRAFSTITAPRKAVKRVNVVRLAKRRKTYAQKLAAYKRSETYKIVEKRAGGRCEHVALRMPMATFVAMRMCGHSGKVRCAAFRNDGARLGHHHTTYARFGGDELPEDMEVLCDPCHAIEEAKHPNRKHGR